MGEGSHVDGQSLSALRLETETGFYLLAIRRGGRYLYRLRRDVVRDVAIRRTVLRALQAEKHRLSADHGNA